MSEYFANLTEQMLDQPAEANRRAILDALPAAMSLGDFLNYLVTKVDYAIRTEPAKAIELAELMNLIAQAEGSLIGQGLYLRTKGHALRAIGQSRTALPLYDEAATAFRKAKAHQEEGRTYMGQFSALSSLGYYDECLKKGKTFRRRLVKIKDDLTLAKLDANLAIVNHLSGQYQVAVRLHNSAIRKLEALGQTDLIYPTKVNRANTLWQLNRFRRAAQDYQDSRAYFEQKGQKALVAVVNTDLGFLLFSQQHYGEALELLISARDGFEATGQTERRALAEIDLAYCYNALGLYREALEYYQAATGTLTQLGIKYETVRAELGCAQVLINMGEVEQALHYLDKVLAIYGEAGSPEQNRHLMAVAWLYRSLLLTDYAESLKLSRQAAAIFGELKLLEWHAQSQLIEADLLRLSGDLISAESCFKQLTKTLNRLNLPHLTYQLHYGLGKLYEDKAAKATAQIETQENRELARQEYRLATDQIETIRAILRPEDLRSAFMENRLGAYETLVNLYLHQPQNIEEAFACVERSKSRSLLDLVSQKVLTKEYSQTEQARLMKRIERLREELNWFYSRLHNVSGGVSLQRSPALDFDSVRQEVVERENEMARFLRKYRPKLFEGTVWQANLLAELKSALEPDQTLIDYYIVNGQIAAFVISQDRISAYYPLCQVAQVSNLQEKLSYQANKFNLGSSYVQRHEANLLQIVNQYLHELYQLLIAPLADNIQGEKLIIVPHGSLHSLPFHAFFDGSEYLIDNYEVAYAPSAAIFLEFSRHPERPTRKLLAVGVPDENLSEVVTEINQITRHFRAKKVLLAEEATQTALEAGLAWCDVLHLASHGVFRQDNPLFSLLKTADGWLSVYDVMNWQFNPALVTLSACQTGLSQPLRGDELLGLARGFFSAGAHALLVSLWSVSDKATARLMNYFYEALASSNGKASALRQAMLRLKEEAGYTHPYYWAAFQAIGKV
jgi:CHAT domain-containing protein